MIMSLMLTFLNIAGMLLFVVFLGMGTGGMALAEVSCVVIALAFGASRLFARDSSLVFQRPLKGIVRIYAIVLGGSPAAFNNLCSAMQIFCINLLLVRMAAPMYLACYSLVDRITFFLYAVIWGISNAALPLIGIAFGEKDHRTIRIILKKCIFVGSIIVGLCGALLLAAHGRITVLFGIQDPAIIRTCGFGFMILAANLNLAFINYLFLNYFTAIGRTVIANILVLCRQVVFTVVPAYILFPAMGIYAVWTSLFIFAEILTLCTAFLAVTVTHRLNPRLSRFLLLDNARIEHSRVIDFSVKNTLKDVSSASTNISAFCMENRIPQKQTMYISLAIEEMVLMINEHSLRKDRTHYTDLRVMIIPEGLIIMRIRNSGKYFNPVEYYYKNKDTESGFEKTMGIMMILKMAQQVEYRETFGVNNLIITIGHADASRY
jgi:anti-sigma regulatory factor (Ser/Thr protein kinase)